MMVGAMPVGLSYPGAATVAGLVQLEGARAAWKLSLNFFLSYNYFSLLSYFFIAFSFLSRKSNIMVKCVTEVTQRLDVDVECFIKTIWFPSVMEEGMEEGTSLLQIFDWSIQSRVSDVFI